MAELKDLAVGNVPARFRGAAREAASVVKSLVDSGSFGKWKDDDGLVDFKVHERVMGMAYQVQQGLDKWVRENPGASREEIRAQAMRLAVNGGKVVPEWSENVPGVAAPEPEVKRKSVGASEVLDELGVDMNEQGNAALLPPLDGNWGNEVQGRNEWRKVLSKVDMKGYDLQRCYQAAVHVIKTNSAAELSELKRMVEAKWAWENGEK